MQRVQTVSNSDNKSSRIKTFLAAEATGAAAGICSNYLLQKAIFRHPDRFIPLTNIYAKNAKAMGAKTSAFSNFIKYIKEQKVDNKELFKGALNGAFWVAIGGALYGIVKSITGDRDKNLEKKTGIAAAVGAIGGAITNALEQNYAIHKMGFINADMKKALKAAAKKPNKKLVKGLTEAIKNFEGVIGNGKIIKTHVALAAAKGAFGVAGLYLLVKGIKETFNKPKYVKPAVVAYFPDDERK